MKILLTGATGSLGRVFLENLSSKSHEIVSLGRKTPESSTVFKHIYFDFLKDFHLKLDWNPDCIIHLAGLASTEGNSKEEYFLANTKSVETLLNYAIQKNVNKFIYSSSGSVYGGGENLLESSPLLGDSYYALSKIEGEKLLENYSSKTLIFRVASVYGKNTKSFIGKLLNYGKKGFLPLPSSGEIKRSFIHIFDVCSLLEKSLELNASGIYNLSHPETWVYLDLIQVIIDTLQGSGFKKPRKIYIPNWAYKTEQLIKGILKRPSILKPLFETSTLNTEKLIREIGRPKHELRESL